MRKGKKLGGLGSSSTKPSMARLRQYLSPRISQTSPKAEEDHKNEIPSGNPSNRLGYSSSPVFIPFESERDQLGRLKPVQVTHNSSHSESHHQSTLPRLQQSIYSQLKEEGVQESVDLRNSQYFKVVDGFERQINVIIRNKEFMKFLKTEREKKKGQTVGFTSQPRDKRSSEPQTYTTPGAYDINYSQVWKKVPDIKIKPESKVEKRAQPSVPYIDLRSMYPTIGNNKSPDFSHMGVRKPLMELIRYDREDSEEREQKELDEYFKQQKRPDSFKKQAVPNHKIGKVPKPLSQNKIEEIKKDVMSKYGLSGMLKNHSLA